MPRRGPTDETWLSNQRDIALYLSPADFTLVAVPYQLLPVLRTMVRKSHEEEQSAAGQMRSIAKSFRDGIALLEAREEGRRSLPFRR